MMIIEMREAAYSKVFDLLDEIKDLYGFDTNAIVSMEEVIEYLTGKGMIDDDLKARLDAYYAEYGVK